MKTTISHLALLFVLTTGVLTTLSSCRDNDDDYIAKQLRNADWQGYVGAYYTNRWSLSGTTYATVMRFTSAKDYYTSGRGMELDYDTRSPRYDYAYCTFKWFIVDGEITLIYDDDRWTPIYILDYHLYDNRFYGYIRDYSNRRIQFDFENVAYNDWDYYNRSGSYGGFSNQNYYHSRSFTDDDEVVPFIDRSEQAREFSGEEDAVSIASGAFAKAMR
ncbi:MAG: hypothetical protein J6Z14_08790 [Prevotella sp.]|nr:hypothetical protein [Prevotella sp.]